MDFANQDFPLLSIEDLSDPYFSEEFLTLQNIIEQDSLKPSEAIQISFPCATYSKSYIDGFEELLATLLVFRDEYFWEPSELVDGSAIIFVVRKLIICPREMISVCN